MQFGVEDVFEPTVVEADDVPGDLIAIDDVSGPSRSGPDGFHFPKGVQHPLRLPGQVGMPSSHGSDVASFQVGDVRGAGGHDAHVFGHTGMQGKVHVGRVHRLVAGDRQTAVGREGEGLQAS